MHEDKLKHLEFIQNIIMRMNVNSFQIKGWTVTIVSAMLAIFISSNNNYFILACLFPITIFCFLDTYYLCQERKFRGLYNDVAGTSESPKDIKLFEMQTDLYKGGEYSYWCVLRSVTIWKMYLSLAVLLVALFYYI